MRFVMAMLMLSACELPEAEWEFSFVDKKVTDAQLRGMLEDHLERIEAREFGWNKPRVQQLFDHNCRELAKQGVISFALRDHYLARFRRVTGYGLPRTIHTGRTYAGTYTRPGGRANANARSNERGAVAEVNVSGEAEAIATAPVPGKVVWRTLRVYKHGGENWPESFRYVAETQSEDVVVNTSSSSSGDARSGARADSGVVVAFAESLPGGRATARATVRPRPGVQLENTGPPRDLVQFCNETDSQVRALLAVKPHGSSTGRRVAIGPWEVAAHQCVRWFPRTGITNRDVLYHAENDTRRWKGDSLFCTKKELTTPGLVRWYSDVPPKNCNSALALRGFRSLATGAPRFHKFGRANGATTILRQ